MKTAWRRTGTLITVLTLAWQHLSWAKSCGDALISNPRSEVAQFWQRKEPLRLGSDELEVITLSHDTEIPPAALINALANSPKLRAELNAFLPPIPVEYILKISGYSAAQLNHFGLKKGAPKDQTSYTLADLQLDVSQRMLPIPERNVVSNGIVGVWSRLVAMTLAAMKDFGVSLKVNPDGGPRVFLEIATDGSRQLPAEMKHDMDVLWKFASTKTSLPYTHLHLGLPTSAVSERQAVTIGGDLEALSVLAFAADSAEIQKHKNMSSPLHNILDRGFVFVKLNEFTTPVPAHDIELRQYFGLKQGLGFIALGAILAKNRHRLRELPRLDYGSGLPDKSWGNIKGVLEWLGDLASFRPEEPMKRLSKDLHELAKKIPDDQTIMTMDIRQEINRFINQRDLQEIFADPEMYLKI